MDEFQQQQYKNQKESQKINKHTDVIYALYI